jgi:hypothetical protein
MLVYHDGSFSRRDFLSTIGIGRTGWILASASQAQGQADSRDDRHGSLGGKARMPGPYGKSSPFRERSTMTLGRKHKEGTNHAYTSHSIHSSG